MNSAVSLTHTAQLIFCMTRTSQTWIMRYAPRRDPCLRVLVPDCVIQPGQLFRQYVSSPGKNLNLSVMQSDGLLFMCTFFRLHHEGKSSHTRTERGQSKRRLSVEFSKQDAICQRGLSSIWFALMGKKCSSLLLDCFYTAPSGMIFPFMIFLSV